MLESQDQLRHILVPCHQWRLGCGLLFPKSSVIHSPSPLPGSSCFVPAHALVSCLSFSPTFIHSYSHTSFVLRFLIHSLPLHLSPVSICPQVTLILLLLRHTVFCICIKCIESPSFSALSLNKSASISPSVRL